MTKQDILDYFSDINYAYNNCNKHDDLSRMLDELIETQPKWIPCSERLPKGKQPILISLSWDNDTPEVRQGNIDDINYWKHYSHITSIAWMPLPEPYRGKEAET